jgi:hypothetical protein
MQIQTVVRVTWTVVVIVLIVIWIAKYYLIITPLTFQPLFNTSFSNIN